MFGAPEVAGGFGLGADDAEFVLEEVAGLEAANGDLFLLEVAVEGGFAGDFGGKLLGVGGGGGNDGAVGVADADVVDLDVLGAGGELEGEDAEGFDASLVADFDGAFEFAGAGAVRSEGVDAVQLIEDVGLAGVVGGDGFGDWGRRGWCLGARDFGACTQE